MQSDESVRRPFRFISLRLPVYRRMPSNMAFRGGTIFPALIFSDNKLILLKFLSFSGVAKKVR